MANNSKDLKSPVEKLALFLDADDFDEQTASTAELSEEVRQMGIDPAQFTKEVKQMVSRALAKTEEDEYVLLAAQTGERQEEQAESDNQLTFVATATINNIAFEILRDAEAYVYLAGAVPEAATHLCLASVCYELTGVSESDHLFKIEGTGLVNIQRFLAQHSRAPEDYPLGFARVQRLSSQC